MAGGSYSLVRLFALVVGLPMALLGAIGTVYLVGLPVLVLGVLLTAVGLGRSPLAPVLWAVAVGSGVAAAFWWLGALEDGSATSYWIAAPVLTVLCLASAALALRVRSRGPRGRT